MTTDFDVIISGSGPAGATAAYFLSKAGKKVLVIEKESLPRYKPCGGGLSLDYLTETFPFSFESVIETKIDTVIYHYNHGQESRIPCRPNVMAMVMRDKFDQFILQQSTAEVLENTKVVGIDNKPGEVEVTTEAGKTYSAHYLIGADGANSQIRRWSGLHQPQQLIGAIEAEVPYTPELLARYQDGPIFIFDEPRAGYSWIFPKANYLSIGIGVLGQTAKLKEHLERIMARYNISLNGVKLHGHPIPVYNPSSLFSTGHILLAGDAAGLADPFSGEGIRPAIKSAQIAANAILNDQTDLYTDLINADLGRRNKRSLFLWKFFIPLRGICLALGAPNPFTTDAILELLSDRHSSLYVAARSFGTLWSKYIPTEIAAFGRGVFIGEESRQEYYRKVYPGWK